MMKLQRVYSTCLMKRSKIQIGESNLVLGLSFALFPVNFVSFALVSNVTVIFIGWFPLWVYVFDNIRYSQESFSVPGPVEWGTPR